MVAVSEMPFGFTIINIIADITLALWSKMLDLSLKINIVEIVFLLKNTF